MRADLAAPMPVEDLRIPDYDDAIEAVCHEGECTATPVPELGPASQWLVVVLPVAWAWRRRQ
jgi:hypothetical protein